jgi:hypothetical protein
VALAAHARLGESELLLPVIERPVPGGERFDLVSPYGYPGPLFTGVADAGTRSRMLAAVVDDLARRHYVSLFVRLHPILNPDGIGTVTGAVVRHGETVVIDLHQPPERLWSETRSGHRNEINRAKRLGHRVRIEDDWSHLERFAALYRATMERVKANPEYIFSDAYFHELAVRLGPRLRLCTVDIDGEIAAGALITMADGIVGYHLSGSDARFVRHAPAKLIVDHVREWGRAEGARWLHLGGGVGSRSDSLFAFKAGFGPGRRPFATWRVVLDAEAYLALGGVPDALDGWFPGYRAESAPRSAASLAGPGETVEALTSEAARSNER